jgi:hypothetical protein
LNGSFVSQGVEAGLLAAHLEEVDRAVVGSAVLRIDHERWGQRPEDLRNLAIKAPHARSRERFLALYEITQGSNATRVAARIGRRPHNVMEWVHRYYAGGPDAVSYRRTGGRVAAPSAAAWDLLSKPSTAGLSDREIARRAGLSPTTVGKLRRDLGAAARDRSVTRHRGGRTQQDLPIALR